MASQYMIDSGFGPGASTARSALSRARRCEANGYLALAASWYWDAHQHYTATGALAVAADCLADHRRVNAAAKAAK